ncbi:MAG TPA: GntR family transcriptional regulator [Thermomicrobiales bacterium]|nr:GntR family transcriptional regulator [Thermomicrobiales bacterium]
MGRATRANSSDGISDERYSGILRHISGDTSRMRSREIAYEAVKNAILSGVFEPRERLIEERLGEALELSRTPIREALAILEHEGLIEAVPYKGLRVRPVTLNEFLGMYEALGMIESVIARQAVTRVTGADVVRLASILEVADRCIPDDVPGHLRACRQFQQALGECAGAPFLTRMLVGIEERSDLYLIHSQQQLSAENMRASVEDRRAILNAVQSGDPERASQAAEKHGEAIRVRWREHYPNE